jgi:biopolymer transport protein ExbD
MAGGAHTKADIIEGINVTPLVDIVLVLLIIFIVTAKIVVAPAVPLDLPTASQSEEVQTIFAVSVKPDGSIVVDGAPCSDAQLRRQAEAAVTDDGALRTVIQADRAVPHGRVMFVLDELKAAGIERVAFGALRPAGSPAAVRRGR